ncbi:MAG TPA: hypothetical protein VFY38_06450 [Pseudonocardia sp.]|nr:hypothetical protein [Pseudonocardia sp.]
MAALAEDQVGIGDGGDDDLVIGYGTRVDITKLDLGYPDVAVQDRANPREDGMQMGIDRLGGRVLNVELEIWGDNEPAALDLLEQVTAAFMGDNARAVPQTYQVLSYRLAGTGEQRRVWGRGRACTPATLDNAHVGVIPVAAQFQTISPYCYTDAEFSDATGLIPEDTGGLVGPLIGPIYASGEGSGSRGFQIGGYRPAWLATRIHGPIDNPIVEVSGQWSYQLLIRVAAGDSILVDPQPWSRQVRRASDGANLAGYLTGTSAWLSDMRVSPGWHEIVLRGADATGTSRVEVFWRNARASL